MYITMRTLNGNQVDMSDEDGFFYSFIENVEVIYFVSDGDNSQIALTSSLGEVYLFGNFESIVYSGENAPDNTEDTIYILDYEEGDIKFYKAISTSQVVVSLRFQSPDITLDNEQVPLTPVLAGGESMSIAEILASRPIDLISELGDGLWGNADADVLVIKDGGGYAFGHGGDDGLIGGAGSDYFQGNAGGDYIEGGDGDDYAGAHDDDDTVYGGTGVDTLGGGGGTDTLYGEDDADFLSGDDGDDDLYGGGGDDFLATGGVSTDFNRMFVPEGVPFLANGAGDDFADGGDGTDTAVFGGSISDYEINLEDDGSITVVRLVEIDLETDQLVNVEVLKFSDATVNVADLVDEPPSGPALFTEEANNRNLENLDRSDFTGAATASLGGADYVVLPDTAAKWEEWAASVSGDGRVHFDAGPGDDTVTGGALSDWIDGGAGHDRIVGSPGGDALWGGSGNDTFDYLINLPGGTKHTLNGGSEMGVDLLKLPGAPGDYVYKVGFAPGPPMWATTKTTITKLGGTSAYTLDTKDIEKAVFKQPINNKDLELTFGSTMVEMLKLADEVYGPKPTLEHSKEPLAYEADYYGDVTADAVVRGWHAVSAIELGMKPADFGEEGALKYSFVDGFYAAYTSGSGGQKIIGKAAGDISEANAMVLTGVVGGKRTLAISFRGTDQVADFDDYPNFAVHFAKFAPLIEKLAPYIAEAKISQVLVSGHSLGAGMVQQFMSKFGDGPGVTYKGFTVGSPGAEVGGADKRIMNFVHTDDVVAKVPDLVGDVAVLGIKALGLAVAARIASNSPALALEIAKYFGPLQTKDRGGSDIRIDSGVQPTLMLGNIIEPSAALVEHNHFLYTRNLIKLIEFARDPDSPFAKSSLGMKLAAGEFYSGVDYQIGVGRPIQPNDLTSKYSNIINAPLPDDDYVLGNNNQNDSFLFTKKTLFANGERVFDGGSGIDTVLIPYKKKIKKDGKIVRIKDDEIQVDSKDGKKKDVWKTVGEFYRVEKMQYEDGKTVIFKSLNKTAHQDDLDLS